MLKNSTRLAFLLITFLSLPCLGIGASINPGNGVLFQNNLNNSPSSDFTYSGFTTSSEDFEPGDMYFSTGQTEHSFPTTTGKIHIIDVLPEIDPVNLPGKYKIEFEVTATGYWPGREGFAYGMASYPLVDNSFHELGEFQEEWAYRGRDRNSYVEGDDVSTDGKLVRNIGDRIILQYDTETKTLDVYVKQVGDTEYTFIGKRPEFTGIEASEGRKLRFAVSGICWQDNGIRIVSSSIPLKAQEITFPALADKTYGDSDFDAGATASSGLAVSYSSDNPDVATIVDGKIHITGAGEATITASQPGDSDYGAATAKTQVLTVNKTTPVLSDFNNITKTYGDADFVLTAPTSTSNGGFTYTSSDENIATIDGSTVKIIGVGTTEITATQVATSDYEQSAINLTLTVGKAEAIIDFPEFTPKTLGDPDVELASLSHEGIGISYSSSNLLVAEVYQDTGDGNKWKLKIKGNGTSNITASIEDNDNYNTLPITRKLSVNPNFFHFIGSEDNVYTFPTSPSERILGSEAQIRGEIQAFTIRLETTSPLSYHPNYRFSVGLARSDIRSAASVGAANSSNTREAGIWLHSGETVYSSNPIYVGDINRQAGLEIRVVSAYILPSIQQVDFYYKQPGDTTFKFYHRRSGSGVIPEIGELLVPGVLFYGSSNESFRLLESIRYGANTSIEDWDFTKERLPAPPLKEFGDIDKIVGDADFQLPEPISLSPGLFSYTSSNENVAIISGNTVTIVGTGTATITATQAATVDYDATDISLALTVNKANQIITFPPFSAKTTTDADFELTAVSNSGLALTYQSSNTAVAEVYLDEDDNKWKVKINGTGETIITAKQPGNDNYKAEEVSQLLTITEETLPIILTSFTAKAEGNYAKLQWQTASEQNNKGFIIYRSGDDGQFEQIDMIPVSVSHISNLTSQIYNYTFTDKTPLNGNNYYQLVQIDHEGKTTELGIRMLNFGLPASDIRLYPNPTDNIVNITYASGKYSQLILSDLSGKVLQTISLKPSESGTTVSLNNYPAGTYLLHLSGNGGTETRKVVKM